MSFSELLFQLLPELNRQFKVKIENQFYIFINGKFAFDNPVKYRKIIIAIQRTNPSAVGIILLYVAGSEIDRHFIQATRYHAFFHMNIAAEHKSRFAVYG